MKKLIAFLLLAGAVFGFSLTVTKDASTYNPTNIVNYAVALSTTYGYESNASVQINITITNSTGDNQSSTQVTTDGTGKVTTPYTLPSGASAGTWTITAAVAYNSSVTGTTTFTVNALYPVSGNLSVSSSYNPGNTVTATISNVLNQINTSYAGPVSVSLYQNGSLSATNSAIQITAGAGSTSFTLSQYAYRNTSWSVNFTFNTSYGAAFAVNSTPRNPGVSASGLSADKGSTASLSITVTNNANFNDALNVNAYSSRVPTSITFNTNATSALAPGASTAINLYFNVSSVAGAGPYPINLTVNSTANAAYANSMNITVTVNPTHVFNISINGTSAAGTPGGSAVPFTLTITNNGEASETYNVTCASNAGWNCTNTSATISTGNGTSQNVTLSASVPWNVTSGTVSTFTVNVTSTYGLSNTTNFNVTAGASSGVSLVLLGPDSGSTYWVKASVNRTFTLAVNNTGNTAQNLTLGVSATSWNLTVSSTDCSISSTTVNAGNNSNFTCASVSGLASKSVTVTVLTPSNAMPCNNATIGLSLLSTTNSSVSATGTVTAKVPCFTTTPVLSFNPTTGALIVQVTSVLREGTLMDASSISSLTYSILNSTGVVLNTGSIALGTAYTLNYSSTTAYPSNSNYTLAIAVTDNSSANYSSGSLTYRFRLVRSVTVAGTTSVSTVAGAAFSLALTSKYDSGDDTGSAPSTSALCGAASGASTYTYSCTAPSSSTTITATSPAITSCAYDINATCTFTSSLSYVLPISVTVGALLPQQQGGGGGGANATANATANVTANLTAGASQSVNISLPAAANITGAGNLTITVSNLANVTQLVNVSLEEQGDYSHFMLNVSAPTSVGAGANATFAVNITPYRYARPGTYTVTVDVLGQKKNYTAIVPSPSYAPNAVNVNRYVETTKNRSSSVVYLEVVNKKFEAANVTIRETIPKALANSTAGITFLTPYTTVVEGDPVVEWVLSLSPGETADIRYSVKKDATNASFSQPEVTETLPPAPVTPAVEVGRPAADNTWALVLIGIVVIVGAVFAYLYFVERPFFYRILAEARMKFEGVTKWLKK